MKSFPGLRLTLISLAAAGSYAAACSRQQHHRHAILRRHAGRGVRAGGGQGDQGQPQAGNDFIVDAHTHICTRKDGYIPGSTPPSAALWFVQLLDDLGKAMGLPNGTKDMTVENFGKLILEGSDTSVAVFNPFGFREDYGGKDMIPIEEQAEVKRRWPTRTVMLGGGLTPNQGCPRPWKRMTMFRGEVPDLRPQALHVRLHEEARLVVRRSEAGIPHCGRRPQARPEEHRMPQGNPLRTVHGTLRASRGSRRGVRRTSRTSTSSPITRRGLTSTSWPR